MKKLELIKVQGKIYNILGVYGGHIHLGNQNDVNNEVTKKGVIWEMQPFFENISKARYLYFSLSRYFRKDVIGHSAFKEKLSKIKLFYN